MQAQKVLFSADAYNLTYLSLRKAISAHIHAHNPIYKPEDKWITGYALETSLCDPALLPLSTEDLQLRILSLSNLIPHASVAAISSLTRTV